MLTPAKFIRNFTLLGHIDHGKSTLADRLLQITHTVPAREMRQQFLDKLASERSRGITIKLQTVRMQHQGYILNLIDTPGHVDFAYEVSRALAAVEGAVILVDAVAGIQAQTVSNFTKAQNAKLKMIPVINKVDLPHAQPRAVAKQVCQTFGFEPDEILFTSAKTGQGVKAVLAAIKRRIPPPANKKQRPPRALVFDSFYHKHQGVITLVRVIDGELSTKNKGQKEKLFLINTQTAFEPLEMGLITSDFTPAPKLSAGEVGYIATGIKDIKKVRVGETITIRTKGKTAQVEPLSGYQEPNPLVFAHFFPLDRSRYLAFRASFEKLALNDAALTLSPVSSTALGFGFKVGFLGQFHLEITKERLEKEFQQETIATQPEVNYQGQSEPWVGATIYTPVNYLSAVLDLCQAQRGLLQKIDYLTGGHLSARQHSGIATIECELPLAELMNNFYGQLKSLSSGFASLDYKFLDYRPANLVQVSLLLNQTEVEELSFVCVQEKAQSLGRSLVEKLKELIPRQQFKIPIQAAVGSKIIARADVGALRKDVTAKLYGGDRTRKDKLLQKQSAGKRRLKKFGRVKIPAEVFAQVLKQQSAS